jgi:hypothetical protein
MTNLNSFLIFFYAFFWVARIRGCIRRNQQPLLRGKDWFFDVPVPLDFYSGPGKKLLHQYRLRMLIPFAFDIPVAAYIFTTGRLNNLVWLVIGISALTHINHLYSVDFAERQARHYALAESEPGSESACDHRPAIARSSLTPRRLRNFSNPWVEWTILICCTLGLGWLCGLYFASAYPDPRIFFGAPLFYLYVQLGLLLVKSYIVAWRTPVPQFNAAEFIELREKTRDYYLKVCDFNRVCFAFPLLLWPIVISFSPGAAHGLLFVWLWLMFAATCQTAGSPEPIQLGSLAALLSARRPHDDSQRRARLFRQSRQYPRVS